MIFYKTLKNIRTSFGLTPEQLAEMMECETSYILTLESPSNKKIEASPEFVEKLREKLGLQGAPITENDRDGLMDRLEILKNMIDYGAIDRAKRWIPRLTDDVRRSYNVSVNLMLDLIMANYHRVLGDMKTWEEMMETLSRQQDEFNARHSYLYLRMVGIRAYMNSRFMEAVRALAKAERLDIGLKYNEVGFYYIYGVCLSDAGYVTSAIDMLRKAKRMGTWAKQFNNEPNKKYDVYIDSYLALNLSIVGRSDEAYKVMSRRLGIEYKAGSKEKIGYAYHGMGSVYLQIERYDDALKNFGQALEYLDKESEAYKSVLHRKANALAATGRINECVSCAEEGMSICQDGDELWRLMFGAKKHSVMLDNPESLDALENTYIPKLIEYEHNEVVVEYYEVLSGFYKRSGDNERALYYSDLALATYRRLYKEKVEGAMM